MRTLTLFVASGLIIFGCYKKEGKSGNQISGTYVREYSFKVANPETGAVVGMRTVRDTIFIQPLDDKFEISNHKWEKNDYDTERWKNMEHSGDRPMVTFAGLIKESSGTIRPLQNGIAPQLTIDPERGLLYKGANRANPYFKVR